MRICSHFLMEKFIFVHWFVQVNRQKTTVKKKITYFLKNYVASLFTFFEKAFAICKLFNTWCLGVRFWDLLYFICLKFNSQYWYLLLRREKCVDSVVIFNKWGEKTFAVSYNIVKAALQYLALVPPRKLTSSIAKKNIHSTIL